MVNESVQKTAGEASNGLNISSSGVFAPSKLKFLGFQRCFDTCAEPPIPVGYFNKKLTTANEVKWYARQYTLRGAEIPKEGLAQQVELDFHRTCYVEFHIGENEYSYTFGKPDFLNGRDSLKTPMAWLLTHIQEITKDKSIQAWLCSVITSQSHLLQLKLTEWLTATKVEGRYGLLAKTHVHSDKKTSSDDETRCDKKTRINMSPFGHTKRIVSVYTLNDQKGVPEIVLEDTGIFWGFEIQGIQPNKIDDKAPPSICFQTKYYAKPGNKEQFDVRIEDNVYINPERVDDPMVLHLLRHSSGMMEPFLGDPIDGFDEDIKKLNNHLTSYEVVCAFYNTARQNLINPGHYNTVRQHAIKDNATTCEDLKYEVHEYILGLMAYADVAPAVYSKSLSKNPVCEALEDNLEPWFERLKSNDALNNIRKTLSDRCNVALKSNDALGLIKAVYDFLTVQGFAGVPAMFGGMTPSARALQKVLICVLAQNDLLRLRLLDNQPNQYDKPIKTVIGELVKCVDKTSYDKVIMSESNNVDDAVKLFMKALPEFYMRRQLIAQCCDKKEKRQDFDLALRKYYHKKQCLDRLPDQINDLLTQIKMFCTETSQHGNLVAALEKWFDRQSSNAACEDEKSALLHYCYDKGKVKDFDEAVTKWYKLKKESNARFDILKGYLQKLKPFCAEALFESLPKRILALSEQAETLKLTDLILIPFSEQQLEEFDSLVQQWNGLRSSVAESGAQLDQLCDSVDHELSQCYTVEDIKFDSDIQSGIEQGALIEKFRSLAQKALAEIKKKEDGVQSESFVKWSELSNKPKDEGKCFLTAYKALIKAYQDKHNICIRDKFIDALIEDAENWPELPENIKVLATTGNGKECLETLVQEYPEIKEFATLSKLFNILGVEPSIQQAKETLLRKSGPICVQQSNAALDKIRAMAHAYHAGVKRHYIEQCLQESMTTATLTLRSMLDFHQSLKPILSKGQAFKLRMAARP